MTPAAAPAPVAVAVAPSSRAFPDLPSALSRAADAFDRAQLAGDGAALRQLLADDYRLAGSDGSVEDRAAFVRDYTTGGFHLDPFVIRQPLSQVWPGGAVLGGVVDYDGVAAGARFHRVLRFADVWALRAGRWRVVYTQVTRLAGE